ncbi:MAG: response regulator [Bryobacteraceae bacterium]|nr:response regulator [Bryobacteraceae bacterium]
MTTTKIARKQGLDLARVLIADDHPASRLTLQTVLEAGGYQVDTAATAAEAVGKLDTDEYALVLTEMSMETPNSGLKVLAHARMMDYKPATAVLKTDLNADRRQTTDFLVAPENLPEFFAQVAALISDRATRLVNRQARHAVASS